MLIKIQRFSPVVLSENMLSISNALMDENTYPLQCEIAEETGVALIDLRTYLAGVEGMESFYRENDGVHFNEEGADAIADFILKSV
jgi:lysophospholipase L1-like esterase